MGHVAEGASVEETIIGADAVVAPDEVLVGAKRPDPSHS